MKVQTMKIEGLPVKDATRSVILHITDSDVRKGRKKNPKECAAAQACKRQLGATEAQVHKTRTYVRFNGHWQRYQTPGSLQAEIVAFDRGGSFEPGEHILLKMPPSKLGKRKSGKTLHRGTRKLRGYHRVPNVRPTALMG